MGIRSPFAPINRKKTEPPATGVVDYGLGEAYEVVKYVHDNMVTLLALGERTAEISAIYASIGHLGDYALIGHNHDDRYALISHEHVNYSPIGHTHSEYAFRDHDHDGVYQPVGNYSLVGHDHDDRYLTIAAASGPLGAVLLDINGKIPTSFIPALSIIKPTVVASQAEQLALDAQEGDIAIRSDLKANYIHNGGTTGTMTDWTKLEGGIGNVSSVNGQSGTVVLSKADVGLGNVDNTNDMNKPVSTAQAAAIAASAYTDEKAMDAIAAMIGRGSHTNITVTYNDAGDALSFAASGGGTSYTDEMAQDAVAALFAAGSHTGITVTYNDAGNAISLAVTGGGSSSGGAGTGSHRYWSLVDITGQHTVGGAYTANVQFQDIQFFSDATASVAITQPTFTASSEYDTSGTYAASNLNTIGGTSWAAYGNSAKWLRADFTTPVSIGSFKITPIGTAGESPAGFGLAYSDDGQIWTLVCEYTATGWASSTPKTFTVPTALAGIGGSSPPQTHAVVNMIASAPYFDKGYNIASITRTAAGRYRVNFTTPFADTKYVVTGGGQFTPFADSNWIAVGIDRQGTKATTYCDIEFCERYNGNVVDPTGVLTVLFQQFDTVLGLGGGGGGGSGGLADAANDGTAYVRKGSAWVRTGITTPGSVLAALDTGALPSTGNNAYNGGIWIGEQVTIAGAGTIDSVVYGLNGAITGINATPAIYTDVGGSPSALLASGPTVVNGASGDNVLPLTAPLEVTAGQVLWVGCYQRNTAAAGFGQVQGQTTAGASSKYFIGDPPAAAAAGALTTYAPLRIFARGTGPGLGQGQRFRLPFFFTTPPTTGETLAMFVADKTFTIPANFAGDQFVKVGSNPAATFVLSINRNGVPIGTVSISTAGVVTLATSNGTAKNVNKGDLVTITGPSATDASIANVAGTLWGEIV